MKRQWVELGRRFDRLTRRERGVLLFGGLALFVIVGFSLADASLAHQRVLATEIDKTRADLAMAKAQVDTMVRQLGEGPDAQARARIAQLSEQIHALDAEMAGINRSLVPPQQMAEILRKMLARDPRVKLIRLKTLPVSRLIRPDEDHDGANVYKHGMELTLQGRYLDMLHYLDRLEALPWQMFWARAQMDARDYPAVRFTVTVYTLSLDKDWLVV